MESASQSGCCGRLDVTGEGVNCLKGLVVQGPNAAVSREREVPWVEISVGDEGKFGRERHWSGGPVRWQSSTEAPRPHPWVHDSEQCGRGLWTGWESQDNVTL